jgi:hypothetical protein
MPELLACIHTCLHFVEAVLEVLAFTGLAAASLVLFGYELATKGRNL